jgi:hypothetical protein
MGPTYQLSLPPHAGRPRLRRRRIPPRPASLRRPAPHLEWLPSCLNSPRHQRPSLTPLNLAPSSTTLKPLTPSLPPRPPLPGAPTAPIKGNENPRPSPPPFPLSPELLRAFLRPHAELKPPPFFASVASPLRCRSCSGEHPSGIASTGSSSSTTTCEHQQTLALMCRAPAKRHCAFLSAPPRSTVDPSHATRSTRHGPGPPDFPLENKSEKFKIPYHFAFRPLSFLKFVPQSLRVWKYYRRTLSF